MGRRDLFQNTAGYNYQMYFSKRNEDYNDSSAYVYSEEKIGPLMTKVFTAMTREKNLVDVEFSFDRDGFTVKTMDDASDMHAGDRVYLMDKTWIVENIQRKPYQNNSEFDRAPSQEYYISLKGA